LCGGVDLRYIWEVALKADEQDFPRDKIRFTQSEAPSPYMEVAFAEVNRPYIDEAPVELNAYYRFSAIFDYLLDELTDYPEFRSCLYDILMHYLTEINLREGLCINEYHGLFLKEDVKSGRFGEQFKEVFNTFARHEIRFVVENMVRLYSLGPSITLLRSVMRQIYPKSIIYLESVDRRELLIYIGKKETPELKRQVGFLISMFGSFDYVTHLFWDLHFGIIGVDETTIVDEFVTY
jgi:hypothetical protein